MPSELMPALWGLLGAVIYAAPRFTACFFSARETGGPWTRCAAEAVTALLTGAIAAAAFGGWLARFIHQTGPGDNEAVCAVIGLLANPTAPGVIEALSGRVLNRFRGEGS